MNLSESGLAGLPFPEQVFTVVNDERIDRGLPPIDYMTNQLERLRPGRGKLGDGPVVPLVACPVAPPSRSGAPSGPEV